MAADARGGRASELASDMTSGAIQGDMRSGQREACHLQVVELGARPGVHPVAPFAGGRKSGGHMIWTRGGLIILGMAGVTLGG